MCIQEAELEITGKIAMVINTEAELLGKQQEIKPGGKVSYQKEGSLNENCKSLTADAKITESHKLHRRRGTKTVAEHFLKRARKRKFRGKKTTKFINKAKCTDIK